MLEVTKGTRATVAREETWTVDGRVATNLAVGGSKVAASKAK